MFVCRGGAILERNLIIVEALNNIPPRRQAVIIIYVNGEEGNNNNCLSVKDLPTVDRNIKGRFLVSLVGEQHDKVLMMLR